MRKAGLSEKKGGPGHGGTRHINKQRARKLRRLLTRLREVEALPPPSEPGTATLQDVIVARASAPEGEQ